MPLSPQQLSELLAKSDAKIDDSVELPKEIKTKTRVSFVCKCGQKHSNEIRGITKNGAKCSACMIAQKGKKISDALKMPVEVPTESQKLCKNCGHCRDLSHFRSEMKGKYTESCKKCRKAANASRKRALENIKDIEVKPENQICNQCKKEKCKDQFINSANGKPAKRCDDCRKSNVEIKNNRIEYLKKIEPSLHEKKCEQCYMNRNVNQFPNSGTLCKICLNIKELGVKHKQKQRKIDKIQQLDILYEERLCYECDQTLPLEKFTGFSKICNDCGTICVLCNQCKHDSEFSMSYIKCTECITNQKKQTQHELYGDQILYCEKESVYDHKTLDNIITNSKATQMEILDLPLTRDSKISFICSCGTPYVLNYVYIRKQNQASCLKCLKQ